MKTEGDKSYKTYRQLDPEEAFEEKENRELEEYLKENNMTEEDIPVDYDEDCLKGVLEQQAQTQYDDLEDLYTDDNEEEYNDLPDDIDIDSNETQSDSSIQPKENNKELTGEEKNEDKKDVVSKSVIEPDVMIKPTDVGGIMELPTSMKLTDEPIDLDAVRSRAVKPFIYLTEDDIKDILEDILNDGKYFHNVAASLIHIEPIIKFVSDKKTGKVEKKFIKEKIRGGGELDSGTIAKIFAKLTRGTLIYKNGTYYAWDGVYWNPAPGDAYDKKVSEIYDLFISAWAKLKEEIRNDRTKVNNVIFELADDDGDKFPVRYGWYMEEISVRLVKIKSKVIKDSLPPLLKGNDVVFQSEDDDCEKYFVAFKNGITVDLNEEDLTNFFQKGIPCWRESRPEDYADMCTSCDFNPNATSDVWIKFLNQTMSGDKNKAAFFALYSGLMIRGAYGEKNSVCIWYGRSGNEGKTTLSNGISGALGSYSTAISTKTLSIITEKNASNAAPDLAACRGKRFISCSENSESETFSSTLIKSLSGGTKISARKLYSNGTEGGFKINGLLILDTNYLPGISDPKLFTTNRLSLLTFNHVVTPDEQDPAMSDKLLKGSSAICNFMIIGAYKYSLLKKNGKSLKSVEPQSVRDDIKKWSEDEDTISQFLKFTVNKINPEVDFDFSNCHTDADFCARSDGYVLVSDLYVLYRVYTTENGVGNLGKKRFTRALEDKGINIIKSHRVFYNGRSTVKSSLIVGYTYTEDAKEIIKELADTGKPTFLLHI